MKVRLRAGEAKQVRSADRRLQRLLAVETRWRRTSEEDVYPPPEQTTGLPLPERVRLERRRLTQHAYAVWRRRVPWRWLPDWTHQHLFGWLGRKYVPSERDARCRLVSADVRRI